MSWECRSQKANKQLVHLSESGMHELSDSTNDDEQEDGREREREREKERDECTWRWPHLM